MSKTVPSSLQAALEAEGSAACLLWKVVRRDGQVFGFTNHDADLAYAGVTYTSMTGSTPSAIVDTNDFAVDNLEVVGVLSSDAIAVADVQNGLWDHAAVTIYAALWSQDPITDVVILREGRLGEIQTWRQRYRAELRSKLQSLQQGIIELTSPECRYDLGDGKCLVNLAGDDALGDPITVNSTVTAITAGDTAVFFDAALADATGRYDFGTLTWTTGDNSALGDAGSDLSMEVKRWDLSATKMSLYLPMPYDIQIGDEYTVVAGCNKALETCRDRYANAVNFGGEPYIPGLDQILQPTLVRTPQL